MKIQTAVEVSNDSIESLLSSMRQSYYWCENAGDFDLISVQQKIMDGGTHTAKEFDEDSGAVIATYPVNLKTLKKGLQKMAQVYAAQFADILNENDDASTADILLQLATIGIVKYG